ncbi:MAG: hypothetical protein WA192_15555 [Candidatus Acidiferrales bacterium]
MNWIERLFVRAKHWQIFLLFVVIFVAAEFPIVGDFTSAVKSQEGAAEVLLLTEVLMAAAAWCFLLWLWSLGSFLNTVTPPELRLRNKALLLSVLYSAFYVVVSIALFHSINPMAFAVTIPLSLLAVFCVFFNLYFVAKSLVLAETGKPATFGDYVGPLLLLWFCLIGVWFIQPRINRLYAERGSDEPAKQASAI